MVAFSNIAMVIYHYHYPQHCRAYESLVVDSRSHRRKRTGSSGKSCARLWSFNARFPVQSTSRSTSSSKKYRNIFGCCEPTVRRSDSESMSDDLNRMSCGSADLCVKLREYYAESRCPARNVAVAYISRRHFAAENLEEQAHT